MSEDDTDRGSVRDRGTFRVPMTLTCLSSPPLGDTRAGVRHGSKVSSGTKHVQRLGRTSLVPPSLVKKDPVPVPSEISIPPPLPEFCLLVSYGSESPHPLSVDDTGPPDTGHVPFFYFDASTRSHPRTSRNLVTVQTVPKQSVPGCL